MFLGRLIIILDLHEVVRLAGRVPPAMNALPVDVATPQMDSPYMVGSVALVGSVGSIGSNYSGYPPVQKSRHT